MLCVWRTLFGRPAAQVSCGCSVIPGLPEVHVDELHERIVDSGLFPDAALLFAKHNDVVGAKLSRPPNEARVEARILETLALETGDKIPIARGQTCKCAKDDFGYQSVRWGSKLRVGLLDGLNRRLNNRNEVGVAIIRAKFRFPERQKLGDREAVNYPQMRGICVLEEESGSSVHAPACEVEAEL